MGDGNRGNRRLMGTSYHVCSAVRNMFLFMGVNGTFHPFRISVVPFYLGVVSPFRFLIVRPNQKAPDDGGAKIALNSWATEVLHLGPLAPVFLGG